MLCQQVHIGNVLTLICSVLIMYRYRWWFYCVLSQVLCRTTVFWHPISIWRIWSQIWIFQVWYLDKQANLQPKVFTVWLWVWLDLGAPKTCLLNKSKTTVSCKCCICIYARLSLVGCFTGSAVAERLCESEEPMRRCMHAAGHYWLSNALSVSGAADMHQRFASSVKAVWSKRVNYQSFDYWLKAQWALREPRQASQGPI